MFHALNVTGITRNESKYRNSKQVGVGFERDPNDLGIVKHSIIIQGGHINHRIE